MIESHKLKVNIVKSPDQNMDLSLQIPDQQNQLAVNIEALNKMIERFEVRLTDYMIQPMPADAEKGEVTKTEPLCGHAHALRNYAGEIRFAVNRLESLMERLQF